MKTYLLVAVVSATVFLMGCATNAPSTPTWDEQPVPTPANPAPAEPEDNDAEQTLPQQANLFYIDYEDGGVNGTLIGCNDSLISVTTSLPTTVSSRVDVLTQVYTMQLSATNQPVGAETTVDQNLAIDTITVMSGNATVALSGTVAIGWVCDLPRIKEQLTAPALQFPQITQLQVTINGTAIDTYLSTQ